MENSKQSAFVDKVNTLVASGLNRPFVPLGPAYSSLSLADTIENLILYRGRKNFEKPNEANASLRARKSVLDVFAYDSQGLREFTPAGISLDPFTRSQLYNARLEIERLLKSYRFEPSRMRMPSGESVKTAFGDVSVCAKLRDVEQWCVTEDCFELAATVIYKVPALKRSARHHIGKVSREETRNLYTAFSHCRDRGFRIFCELLRDIVTFVPGSRIETVPKSNDVDRVISCEPFLNMIVQSVQEEGIRAVIRKEFNIDLNTAQDVHKALIADGTNATIDLKNASNSNWLAVISWLYPVKFVNHLTNARSPIGKFEDHSHEWNMIAPMGNGFTFGLMTFTLLCLARQYDSFAHVFGDDIIIDSDVAPAFIDLLLETGWQINHEKTFLHGPFKESCGGFIHGSTYLTSYKIEWATNVVEACVTVNKIQRLAALYNITWLRRLAADLLGVTPPLCKRWVPTIEITGEYVCYTAYSQFRKLRNDPEYNHLRKGMFGKRNIIRNVKKSQLLFNNLAVGYRFSVKSDTYRSVPVDHVHHHWLGHYLFAGRCSAPTRRNRDTIRCELDYYEVAISHDGVQRTPRLA